MIHNEKELANAIMNGENRIELSEGLSSAVSKIKDPSEVVWKAVFSALIASAFFWGGVGSMTLGLTLGLPVVLSVCGGVGGVVFVTLGANGTLCAFRMLAAVKTIDVLTKLRDNYTQDKNILINHKA